MSGPVLCSVIPFVLTNYNEYIAVKSPVMPDFRKIIPTAEEETNPTSTVRRCKRSAAGLMCWWLMSPQGSFSFVNCCFQGQEWTYVLKMRVVWQSKLNQAFNHHCVHSFIHTFLWLEDISFMSLAYSLVIIILIIIFHLFLITWVKKFRNSLHYFCM